jgi:hypothetical protein
MLLIVLVGQLVALVGEVARRDSMTWLDWLTGILGPSVTVALIAVMQRVKD